MSATTQGQDQEAFLVRLRRDISEAEKLSAKREQLMQEALKLQRDRLFDPVIAIGGILIRRLCMIVGMLGLLLRR